MTTTTTTTTVAGRVAAGANWLDEHHPGWVDRIDLDRLVMSNCDRCVLGQISGDYDQAARAMNDDVLAALGFDHDDWSAESWSQVQSQYAELADAWRDLIRQRREAGAA